MRSRAFLACLAVAVVAGVSVSVSAQGRQGRGGPPPTPRAAAPADFTGTWVAVISEDWRWRMITPPRGDYASIPVNAEARRVGDTWDPARDEAAGEQCRGYAAPAIMREPTRLRISWQDDATLKIETDAGMQTRLLHFGGTPPATATRDWQGYSVAQWEPPLRGVAVPQGIPFGLGARLGARGKTLEVVTTQVRQGYLRKNGVPFGPNMVLNEYFVRFSGPRNTEWFVVTSVVTDPQYLTDPWVTSLHFRKEPDDSKWSPEPCRSR